MTPKPNQDSDTPETDEQVGCGYEVEGKVRLVQLVQPDFARRLERQRNEARQAFAIATDQLVQVQGELRQARELVARLRQDLDDPPADVQERVLAKLRSAYANLNTLP